MFIAAVCFAAVALAVARLTGEGASAGLAAIAALIAACLPLELCVSAAMRTRALTRRLRRAGIFLGGERALRVLSEVDALAFDPLGLLITDAREAVAVAAPLDLFSFEKLSRAPSYLMLMMSVALCSSVSGNKSDAEEKDSAALRAFAWAYGFDADKLAAQYPRITDAPDWMRAPGTRSQRRANAVRFTLHREKTGMRLFAQGAPESLLPLCDGLFDGRSRVMSDAERIRLEETAARLRCESGGVVAFATAEASEETSELPQMTFVGMIALSNVVLQDALDAINTLRVQRINPTLISALSSAETAALIGRIESNRIHTLCSPDDKARVAATLRKQGNHVAALGATASDAMMARAANAALWIGRPPRCDGETISTDARLSSFTSLPLLFEEASREMEKRSRPLRRSMWIAHAALLICVAALCALVPPFSFAFAGCIPILLILIGFNNAEHI
jgi:magnesium-transporting ATPase (P-type)